MKNRKGYDIFDFDGTGMLEIEKIIDTEENRNAIKDYCNEHC
jgi:hypothetical protein